jgi:hypothetical protein
MNIPLLMAAAPLVIPARNYDRIWIEAVEISAPRPDGDAVARVRLRRFAVDESGVVHTEPDSQKLEIADILSKATTDPTLAAAIEAIMAYIAQAGAEQGVIA